MPSAIVIGTGGVGSAAAFHLAQRGTKVLGLDRFAAAHDRGSSHGGTRINRQALFEHPDYVPLAVRSYELWDQLAERAARQLYHEVGLVQIGPPDGAVVPGVLKASAEHNLSVDALSADEVHAAWPGFHVPEGYAAAFEDERFVRAAVDQQHAAPETEIAGAREIAFFPPVTGG